MSSHTTWNSRIKISLASIFELTSGTRGWWWSLLILGDDVPLSRRWLYTSYDLIEKLRHCGAVCKRLDSAALWHQIQKHYWWNAQLSLSISPTLLRQHRSKLAPHSLIECTQPAKPGAVLRHKGDEAEQRYMYFKWHQMACTARSKITAELPRVSQFARQKFATKWMNADDTILPCPRWGEFLLKQM